MKFSNISCYYLLRLLSLLICRPVLGSCCIFDAMNMSGLSLENGSPHSLELPPFFYCVVCDPDPGITVNAQTLLERQDKSMEEAFLRFVSVLEHCQCKGVRPLRPLCA